MGRRSNETVVSVNEPYLERRFRVSCTSTASIDLQMTARFATELMP